MVFSYFYVSAHPFLSSRWSCQFFSNDVLLFKCIRSFSTSARSILCFLNGVCYIFPKLPLFSHPPTFFFKDSFILIKYPFIHVKSLHSFQSMFLSGDSQEDTNEASSSSFFVLFSSPVDPIQTSGVDHIPFPRFKRFLMQVHLLIIHFSLFNSSRVLKISQKIQVFHFQCVQALSRLLSYSSHLSQPAQSIF